MLLLLSEFDKTLYSENINRQIKYLGENILLYNGVYSDTFYYVKKIFAITSPLILYQNISLRWCIKIHTYREKLLHPRSPRAVEINFPTLNTHINITFTTLSSSPRQVQLAPYKSKLNPTLRKHYPRKASPGYCEPSQVLWPETSELATRSKKRTLVHVDCDSEPRARSKVHVRFVRFVHFWAVCVNLDGSRRVSTRASVRCASRYGKQDTAAQEDRKPRVCGEDSGPERCCVGFRRFRRGMPAPPRNYTRPPGNCWD